MNYRAKFTSKADTLQWLISISDFNIPHVTQISARDWQQEKKHLLNQITSQFSDKMLAIRSSCSKEDTCESSGAGAFTSILNIPANDHTLISDAVENVFSSYGFRKDLPDLEQVLIQPMIEDIEISGVILTRTLSDGAPYYVINYDDESGRTDTITSGSGASKTVYIYAEASQEDFDSHRLYALFDFAQQVEDVCGGTALDIEFGMDSEETIHLFQVRPICTSDKWKDKTNELVQKNMSHITSFVNSKLSPPPHLYGEKTILGVMPDWNPAEMIGVTPHPLASSLYRELITRRVWSKARELMGYREMPPEELMVLVAGRPYIDVRASFNSFIPAELNSSISEKLVSAWLERLDSHPELHDKIEFDIALTIMDFCFDSHMERRYPETLSPSETKQFRNTLSEMTAKCLNIGNSGSMAQAEMAIGKLFRKQQKRSLADTSYLSHINSLVEECKQLGTLPFSVLARHGFISESLLRTAITRGAITSERVSELKNSIETISGKMSHAFSDVVHGKLEQKVFLKQYGHLRPGSYDILSPCYNDRPDLFNNGYTLPTAMKSRAFEFTQTESKNISGLLKESGLNKISPKELLQYIERAIAGREYGKFVFTRNISDILELLAKWGEQYGYSRNDLAHLQIEDILKWNTISLLRSPQEYFSEQIEKGKQLFDLGRSLQLGYLIRSTRDLFVVPQHRSAPNFVGNGSIEAQVVSLDVHSSCDIKLSGCIVCIENADPGFDWIFTRGIAGLVTKFGGANSHMAIRCAEYGLPAAIGVGEKMYAEISSSAQATLNAGNCTLQGRSH